MICEHDKHGALSVPYLGELCPECRERLNRLQLLEGVVSASSLLEIGGEHARCESAWVKRYVEVCQITLAGG